LKKLTLLLLSLSSLLLADSSIYIGTGYAYDTEKLTYESNSKTINNNEARVKIGYGDRSAYAIELSLDYVDNHSNIFDANDGKKYAFNVELLKAWDFGIIINPYLKAGFGAGYLETDADLYNNSLTYGSFNLGSGFFLPINKHLDLEFAYEYKNLSYQPLNADTTSSSKPTSNLHVIYLGVNFRF
jgi:opacity protein-like surface antigen